MYRMILSCLYLGSSLAEEDGIGAQQHGKSQQQQQANKFAALPCTPATQDFADFQVLHCCGRPAFRGAWRM